MVRAGSVQADFVALKRADDIGPVPPFQDQRPRGEEKEVRRQALGKKRIGERFDDVVPSHLGGEEVVLTIQHENGIDFPHIPPRIQDLNPGTSDPQATRRTE